MKILKLYNEENEMLIKGNQYDINNYMMFNGIEYTFESIEVKKDIVTIFYDNGDKLIIEDKK